MAVVTIKPSVSLTSINDSLKTPSASVSDKPVSGGNGETIDMAKNKAATYEITPETAKSESSFGTELWKQVKDIGGNVLASNMAKNPETALNEYNSKLAKWQEEGKYWMVPGSETKPFIDDYLANMPSVVGAGIKGSTFGKIGSSLDKKTLINNPNTGLIGGAVSTVLSGGASPGTTMAGVGAGSAASKSGKNTDVSTQDFINPAGYLAKMFGASDDQVNYIWGKSTDGFVNGLKTGGIVGGVVNAGIGLIQGIFGYNDAIEADREARKQALEKYERELAVWTYNRNSRIIAQQEALVNSDIARRKATSDTALKDIENANSKKLAAVTAMRNNLVSALTSPGATSSQNRQSRLARWSK
jgi:hypothetical protein